MMDPEACLESLADFAFNKLKGANGDLSALSAPLQTLVLIYSAQGLIDNGGLRYFFENDWPGLPSYSVFSNAYRTVGADNIGEAIDAAAALFPFVKPHLNAKLRNDFLDSLPEGHAFHRLSSSVCGDPLIWARLAAFSRLNMNEMNTN